ncbi:MAG: molybdopterin molybdotransferase MoeA [Sulfurospirillaceae bacterium]|nr:molybdopterin molybdotransferase MoeA [Sulfurospirillaceae bacterium]
MLEKYEDTLKALENSIDFSLGSEKVFITEALNRILSQDIVATFNNPEYVTASMDGYAIRSVDQSLEKLTIIDRLPAGSYKGNLVTKGTCVKTFTGSLMSEGSDTLIPIENVEVTGDTINIVTPVEKGFSARPIGENYKKGEILIKKGTKIRYAEIGVLAELGYVQVSVFVKPRISILATGSEILDFGEERENISQIRSSNHVTIEAILREHGAQTSRLEIVKDDKDKIKKVMLDALNTSDVLITTGGVSVGDFDFVKEVLGDIQPIHIVDSAFIKPGRHIKVVRIGRKYIFSLPGFPYSSSVVAFLYVLPFLRKISAQEFYLPVIKAYIQEDYKKRSKYKEFTACNISTKDGKLFVNLHGKKEGSSAILNNMLDNAALLCIDEDTKMIEKNSLVDVFLLDFSI